MSQASPYRAALSTAFRAARRGDAKRGANDPRPFRIHPSWIVLAGPAAGSLAVFVVFLVVSLTARSLDGTPPSAKVDLVSLGIAILVASFAMIVLGVRSFIRLDDTGITVRFYGIRSTTLRYDELASATFAMRFPSISWGIKLTDRHRRHAVVHANWWKDEPALMEPILRALLEHDVAMDHVTTGIVARTLKVKRPERRIVHRGLFNRKRTW